MQPLSFLFIEMAENEFARGWSAEMNIRGFPSHGVQQAQLGIGRTQGCEFDARAMRSEAACDPASAQLHERIGTAHGLVEEDLVKNFGGAFVRLRFTLTSVNLPSAVFISFNALCPMRSGGDERFGFASDAASMPVGDANVAGVAKAAESSNAVGKAKRNAGRGHEVLQGIDGADGAFGFERGERVYLRPEVDGIAEFAFGYAAEPLMLFAKHKGASFRQHALAVASEHGATDIFTLERQAPGVDGKMSADGEAD